MTFSAPITIRWSDLDAQGHVNNVVYAEYLQQARTQLLTASDSMLLDDGCVVVEHRIAYRHPIYYSSDPLHCKVWLPSVGGARLQLAYQIWQDEQLCAEAISTLCAYDVHAQQVRRLTEQERTFFDSFPGAEPDLAPLEAPALDGRGTVLDLQQRWSDLDAYGHVNNVCFLEYGLAARIDMTTRAHPSLARVGTGNEGAVNWLIARQDVTYLEQLGYGSRPVRVLTAPVRLGTTSITIASEVIDPDDASVYAQMQSILVCADNDGQKQPLPEDGRAALEKLLVTEN